MDEEATKEEDQDVRLCAALRGLLGGSKYVKQSELSRKVLLSYAIQKGDVVPVTLFTVTVEPLAGDIFDVKMEKKQNSVKQLRLLIQQEQGTPLFSQTLFLLPKSGKTEEASEFPLTDEQSIEGSCSVVLCVDTQHGESFHSLLRYLFNSFLFLLFSLDLGRGFSLGPRICAARR